MNSGISQHADFETDLWTFKMDHGYRVGAGRYIIIDQAEFEERAASLQDIGEECGCPPGTNIRDYLIARCKRADELERAQP